jgi:hypothetical protein
MRARPRALAMCLALGLLAASPLAQAATAGRVYEPINQRNINVNNPAAGYNSWPDPNGRAVGPGAGWVEYRFTLDAGVDFIEVWSYGTKYTPEPCTWTLVSFTEGVQTQPGNCVGSTWSGAPDARFNGLYVDSYTGGEYRLQLHCSCPGGTGVLLQTLVIKSGYRELTLAPIIDHPSVKLSRLTDQTYIGYPQQCITVHIEASTWMPVVYFRISWGDGTQEEEHYIPQGFTGVYEEEFCHTYPPSISMYQACVSVHDVLGRSVRECRDVSWGVEKMALYRLLERPTLPVPLPVAVGNLVENVDEAIASAEHEVDHLLG